jgi:hypothetical protein
MYTYIYYIYTGDKEKKKGDKDQKLSLEKDPPNLRGRERAPSVAAPGNEIIYAYVNVCGHMYIHIYIHIYIYMYIYIYRLLYMHM